MYKDEKYQSVEVIIILLNLMKKDHQDNYTIAKGGAHYLLGQALRQIRLPQDRYFISIKAEKLWKEITDENIYNYYYRKKVTNKLSDYKILDVYKGASSELQKLTIKKSEGFIFRDVFHDDHIIPIKVIIEKLIEIEIPNYENVMHILELIGICRMLKSEDRAIYSKSSRPFDEREIITYLYVKSGIYIKDYDYK